ncbi:MAG: molybdenum cofactor guanylyltransferase [Caldilineaceae bacterium]|nr:molybdenum cofactor guanylyltransferase [Caldilineaceae bacterium]
MLEEPMALVVNAGGRSRRMGHAKALLPLPETGTPLVVHIVRRLLPLVTDRVVVVTNDPAVEDAVDALAGLLVVQDEWAEGGALGGVATGLAACAGWTMVVACDMPFVDAAIFAKLVHVAQQEPRIDAVIPRVDGQAQPFHSLWHRRGLPKLVARLEAGELGVQAALETLDVVWMDEIALGIAPDARAFCNINTPEEWVAVRALLEEERPVA